ncbi:MAG TPA: alpha/beta fold hydrolase [Thermoanaerobaculia bacterium]
MHFLVDGPKKAERTFIFAHGAGGAMDTPWMTRVARGLAEHGIRVVRFEFPYMAARRKGGKRGAPDREPVLLDAWREAVAEQGGPKSIAIGGKSMGGRMASMVADELKVAALVCFGYPFHPPGQPAKTRTAHLESLKTRALILQGERDTFGSREDVAGYKLSRRIHVEWLPDGDHSFKPRASSGVTEAENIESAVSFAANFLM